MSKQTVTRQPHKKKLKNYSKVPDFKNGYKADMKFGYATIVYCPLKDCWLLPDGPNQKVKEIRLIHTAHEYAKKMHEAIIELSGGFPRNIAFASGTGR
jgi:hypothetical protein